MTASPVPIGTVPIEEGDQVAGSCGLGTRPLVAPGHWRPVGWPKPKSRKKYERRLAPSRWAISIVPMFDDWARIWVALSCSVAWKSASENGQPPSEI